MISSGVEKANKSVGHDSSEEEEELSLQTRNNETIVLQKKWNPSCIASVELSVTGTILIPTHDITSAKRSLR